MSEDAPDNNPSIQLSPLEGGPWRPVQPEELLRRGVVAEDPSDESPQPVDSAVQLQRRQELERFLQPNPADVDAYLELAQIYRTENRPIEARKTLQRGLQVQPDDRRLLWEFEEAKLAQSLQHLRSARELAIRYQTVDSELELERAKVNWAARRVEVCRGRLARSPEDTALRVVLGEALRDLEKFKEAIDAVATATRIDALAPAAYLLRGQCYQALGKPMKALPEYRAAAMRRAVPADLPTRITALQAAVDLASHVGLPASLKRYERFLKMALAERDLAANSNSPARS
ncbi:Tetratricopeptide repeat protein [Roseimaritima multifibrata]|uniref:Tetratricopeptide repeat protein n=1 Tax=Roseimaritima multifibrata TaxID=1930274 RepID=A0A517MDJ0_9BACT|nr:tetratricopeptide repeat protein [Roseimaritima multifibrata]QDS92847.1 Tetratricopeptide repeat protein [Roseimaritima multifibrata]